MQSSQESQHSRTVTTTVPSKPEPSPEGSNATPLLDKAEDVRSVPRGWPTAPRAIRRSIYTTLWSIFTDLILLACSIAFFAFGLIVNSYDNVPTKDNPRAKERLLSASKYGPTVFPILFAAVVGRAAHATFLWRLERGERIRVLDTLASSTSLTNTVTSLCRLRIISLLGVVLIAIWALSPVGGQASFRQLSIGAVKMTESNLYEYFVTTTDLSGYYDSGRAGVYTMVNTLFLAAIMAKAKNSPLDLWGNVKMPRVEFYEGTGSQLPDKDGWFETHMDHESNSDVYASLIGVPMSGLLGSGFIDHRVNLHTMYLNLSCDKHEGNVPNDTFRYDNQPGNGLAQPGATLWIYNSPGSFMRNITAFANGTIPAQVFAYGSPYGEELRVQCTLRTTYIEVEVLCADSTNCLASRVRRSRLDHPSTNLTQLDIAAGPYYNLDTFARYFVGSATSRSSYPTLLDYYIAAPENPALPLNWSTLSQPADVTSVRLGQLINAYWSSMTAKYALSAGLTDKTSYLDPNVSFALVAGDARYPEGDNTTFASGRGTQARLWQAQGTRSRSIEVFQAHKAWVATLCIASAVLILTSLIPPIVRHFLTNGPELMMNISSLVTRDNPYWKLPPNGTYLNASDRSRLLKDCKVRFGDVDSKGDAGILAIGELENEKAGSIDRVKKGRKYE